MSCSPACPCTAEPVVQAGSCEAPDILPCGSRAGSAYHRAMAQRHRSVRDTATSPVRPVSAIAQHLGTVVPMLFELVTTYRLHSACDCPTPLIMWALAILVHCSACAGAPLPACSLLCSNVCMPDPAAAHRVIQLGCHTKPFSPLFVYCCPAIGAPPALNCNTFCLGQARRATQAVLHWRPLQHVNLWWGDHISAATVRSLSRGLSAQTLCPTHPQRLDWLTLVAVDA